MKNPNRSPVSKQRTAVSTNSKLKSVHQHLFFSALSVRSLAWSLALAERPLAGQWTAPGSSHWRATQSRYWHHFGHQLTHHFGHTPQPPCTLKKGHDTFRVYILHRDIRTERARGDAYEFAPEAMHESVPEARPLPAQHSANHS